MEIVIRRGVGPVVFPADTVKDFFEEFATIDMHERAFARDDAFETAGAVSGEGVGGRMSVAAGAFTGNDKTGVDDGADERYTLADGLGVDFVRVKLETELVTEVVANNGDIAHELGFLVHRDNDKEIVNVATVMFITEVESNKAIELVEEDIRDELASKITNDDAAALFAVKEAFVRGEGGPVGFGPTDDDVAHGIIVNDLMPEKLKGLVELITVARLAGNGVFGKVILRECMRINAALELPI